MPWGIDVDQRRAQLELVDDVLSRGVRAGDDPVRAPRRRRDRRLGAPSQRRGHRARQAPEDEVVQRQHAREGTVQGREVRRAVQDLDFSRAAARGSRTSSPSAQRRRSSGRRARSTTVLSARSRQKPVPEGGGLAVDEGRDAQVVALRADRRRATRARRSRARPTRRGRGRAGRARDARYPSAARTARQYATLHRVHPRDARRALEVGRVQRGRQRGGEARAARSAASPAPRGGGAASPAARAAPRPARAASRAASRRATRRAAARPRRPAGRAPAARAAARVDAESVHQRLRSR